MSDIILEIITPFLEGITRIFNPFKIKYKYFDTVIYKSQKHLFKILVSYNKLRKLSVKYTRIRSSYILHFILLPSPMRADIPKTDGSKKVRLLMFHV